MKKTIIILLLVFWVCFLSAQDTLTWSLPQREDLLFRFEELINEDESNQEELEELLIEEQEKFQEVTRANLNALTPEMAFAYLKLTDYQYYNLLAYLSEYGMMASVYELNAVEGFSIEDVRRLMPLVNLESVTRKNNFFKNFFRKSKSSFLLRYGQVLEKQNGYDKSQTKHYLGSPFRLAFKYQFSTQDKFVLAISGEKDAGEQFFKGAQKYGFDFYSAYLCLKNIGVLKKLVIGDFKLDFGQGLVVGSAMMGGKGGGVGSVRHFAGMIKPVAPLNEGTALRGVAATLGNYHYTGTLFAAYRNYDGNVLLTEDSSRVFEGSLSHSGYHRTEAEQAKSDNLRSWVFGADFLYRARIFRLGARALYTLFNAEVQPSGKVYQQYAFTGRSLVNAGLDYQLILKKVILYGEAGLSGNGGWAFVQGANVELSPGVSFALLAHFRSRRYVALQGSSSAQGEWGFYLVSQMILNPKTTMSWHYDYTHYFWLRYRIDAPSNTMRAGLDLTCAVSRKAHLQIRFQYKMKYKNMEARGLVNGIEPFHSFKAHAVWESTLVELLKLKTGVDYLINHSKTMDYTHDGLLLYQDVGLDLKKPGLGFNMRIAFFDTDTYEERLYAYENDLYYSFTMNSHYDKGWRAYLLVKYAYKMLHVWIRISQTFFLNKEEIGSGLDLIAQKHKTELKLQLMVKW
jgi:hypothetical protein